MCFLPDFRVLWHITQHRAQMFHVQKKTRCSYPKHAETRKRMCHKMIRGKAGGRHHPPLVGGTGKTGTRRNCLRRGCPREMALSPCATLVMTKTSRLLEMGILCGEYLIQA